MPYQPRPIPMQNLGRVTVKDVGNLLTEFESFEPDPQYRFAGRVEPKAGEWRLIKPKNGPPIGDLPEIIKRLVKSLWKVTEPSRNNIQGWHGKQVQVPGRITIGARAQVAHGIAIGTRSGAVPTTAGTGLYTSQDTRVPQVPQVRPVSPEITTKYPTDSAIVSDWHLFNWIRRTNAVTFRGDTRPSPIDVIAKGGGFYPPNSRKDDGYIKGDIYAQFSDYLNRRYGAPLLITNEEFLDLVKKETKTDAEKSLFVDYMEWRSICAREVAHLGRMVERQTLKGYISTARSIDTSLNFATNFGKTSGWLYVTVVHSGFVVPLDQESVKHYWGSEEAEIAQWGPIPANRIVGFVRVKMGERIPDGPIFFRRSFRMQDPEAFEYMFKVISGMVPAQSPRQYGRVVIGLGGG